MVHRESGRESQAEERAESDTQARQRLAMEGCQGCTSAQGSVLSAPPLPQPSPSMLQDLCVFSIYSPSLITSM